MGQAQNGTGVMAKQMEIHPDRNDVINTAESTFLSCMGKPLHLALALIQMCTCDILL